MEHNVTLQSQWTKNLRVCNGKADLNWFQAPQLYSSSKDCVGWKLRTIVQFSPCSNLEVYGPLISRQDEREYLVTLSGDHMARVSGIRLPKQKRTAGVVNWFCCIPSRALVEKHQLPGDECQYRVLKKCLHMKCWRELTCMSRETSEHGMLTSINIHEKIKVITHDMLTSINMHVDQKS